MDSVKPTSLCNIIPEGLRYSFPVSPPQILHPKLNPHYVLLSHHPPSGRILLLLEKYPTPKDHQHKAKR